MDDVLKRELRRIKADGGASLYWIMETNDRKKRIDKAERDGLIVRNKEDNRYLFPWCVFEVTCVLE